MNKIEKALQTLSPAEKGSAVGIRADSDKVKCTVLSSTGPPGANCNCGFLRVLFGGSESTLPSFHLRCEYFRHTL